MGHKAAHTQMHLLVGSIPGWATMAFLLLQSVSGNFSLFLVGFLLHFCFVLVFFITQAPLQDVSTAEHDLHYAPFQQSDQCMQISAHAVSCSLQRSQAKRIQLQDWDLNWELQHPCTKLGLSVYKAMQMRPPFPLWVWLVLYVQ